MAEQLELGAIELSETLPDFKPRNLYLGSDSTIIFGDADESTKKQGNGQHGKTFADHFHSLSKDMYPYVLDISFSAQARGKVEDIFNNLKAHVQDVAGGNPTRHRGNVALITSYNDLGPKRKALG